MITVHEFGHYVVGKIFKFKINEFAIGMGPALFKKKKKNGEIFSIRAFPLGGFCAFEGEDEDNDNPNAFNNKKPWQRILVLIAGAFMNFLLALFIIGIMFSCYGKAVYQVKEVHPNASYEQVLQNGDGLLEINGRKIFLSTDLIKSIDGLKGQSTIVIVAHRLTTIIDADIIFFLEDGQITGQGTFEELYATNPVFKRLFLSENMGV